MKILAEAFAKDGDGHVRLVPETSDDMWHVFNLLRAGDRVEATTFRKVSKGAGGASHAADHGLGGHGGSGADTVRVRVKLRLDVESVEYAGDGEAVRVRGRNTTDTPHVKLGAYHTLEIDANRAVVIEKTLWDAADAKRLRELADPAASADLAVLLITEGLANLALVGASVTSFRAKVEKTMPRKTGASALGYDRALNAFYKNVLRAVATHVDFDKVKCLVVAGPGFARETFAKFAEAEANRQGSAAGGGSSGGGTSGGGSGGAGAGAAGAAAASAAGPAAGPGRRRTRPSGSGTNRRSSRRRRRPRSGAVCARFWTRTGRCRVASRIPKRRSSFARWTIFSRRWRSGQTAPCTGPRTSSRRTPSAPSRRCSSPTGCFEPTTRTEGAVGWGSRRRWRRRAATCACSPPRTPRGRSSRKSQASPRQQGSRCRTSRKPT